MWIYSLGVTLQKTISSFSVNYQQRSSGSSSGGNDGDAATGRRSAGSSDEDGLTALDHVILAMCEANLYKRASLMFLLDVSIAMDCIFFFPPQASWNLIVAHCIHRKGKMVEKRQHSSRNVPRAFV